MNEQPVYVGWKCNELLIHWRSEYWRWTSTYHAEKHKFELLTDEHKEGWNLIKSDEIAYSA